MTSIADYNNNPGNLRPPKGLTYPGQIGVDDRGFAIFENKEAGRNALIQDIRAKQKQGLNNPNAFIDKYTPASAENPEEGRDNYKIRMAQHLGLKSTTDPFPKGSEEKIADLIAAIEGGEAPAPSEKKEPTVTDPFAGYQPKAKSDSGEPLPPLVPEVSNTERVMGAIADTGEYVANKALENPEIPAAAGVGLGKGILEKVLQSPEKHLVKPGETTPAQVEAARLQYEAKRSRLENLVNEISERQARGVSADDLQREYKILQAEAQGAGQELRARTQELREIPKTYVPPEAPAAAETAEQIAARTKPGASGASNWVRAMGEDIPEVLAAQAENMRKDNPKGGQAIIDANTAAKEKLQGMGLGDYKLTEAGPGQLAVPPDEAARLEREIAERQSREAAERAALAQAEETKRLAAEADLQRQRQLAQQRVEQARQRKVKSGEAAAEAKRRANAAAQQAKSDAAKIETARVSGLAAKQTAREVAEAQPSAFTTATREAGRRFAEKAPIIGNVLGAAGATLSADEAVKRYKEGDYSGAVLGTIEAALNAASMAPPTSPAGLMAKGVGTVGSLGMIPVWIAHDYFGKKGPWAEKKEPQKARGGLTLMR